MAKKEELKVALTLEDVIDYIVEREKNKNLSINAFARSKVGPEKSEKIIIADCSNLDLLGVNLSGADLSNAIFNGANLEGANLTGANLEGSNLRGADFSNARCAGVILTKTACAGLKTNDGTDLGGANITGVKGKLRHTDIHEKTTSLAIKDKAALDAEVNEWETRSMPQQFKDGLSNVIFESAIETKAARRAGGLLGSALFGVLAYGLATALLVGSTIASAGTIPLIIAGITAVGAIGGGFIGAKKGVKFITALAVVAGTGGLLGGIGTVAIGFASIFAADAIAKEVTGNTLGSYLQTEINSRGITTKKYRENIKIARAAAYRAEARGEIPEQQSQNPALSQKPAVPEVVAAESKDKRKRSGKVNIFFGKKRKKRRKSSIAKKKGSSAEGSIDSSTPGITPATPLPGEDNNLPSSDNNPQVSAAITLPSGTTPLSQGEVEQKSTTPTTLTSTVEETKKLVARAVSVPLPDDAIGLGSTKEEITKNPSVSELPQTLEPQGFRKGVSVLPKTPFSQENVVDGVGAKKQFKRVTLLDKYKKAKARKKGQPNPKNTKSK